MIRKKIHNYKYLVPVAALLLTFSVSYPLSGVRDKQRQQAFKLYTAQEYESALPLLRNFVFQDSTVFYVMDYFMLADIYIRNADKDSALLVISRGRSLSENKQDDRLLKRNLEFFDSLEVQLKYRTTSLKTPELKSLESYVEIVADTTLTDSLSLADSLSGEDSLAAADTLTAAEALSPDSLEIALPDSLAPLLNTMAPEPAEPDSAGIQGDFPDTEEQSGEEK